jgi:HD superfamily phosphohydrolase
MNHSRQVLQDAVYGPFELERPLRELAGTPAIQRLRHVRLSNIDSIDMPGIANVSRYEHVLGVAHLASRVGFAAELTYLKRLALCAAAMLHDWAITAFGHLMEEAYQYAGTGFDHEHRLREIVASEAPEEINGLGRQILLGRETGLPRWLTTVTDSPAQESQLLRDITDFIAGQGSLGPIVAGDIDVDNIDNVFRLAHHMGLEVDRRVPVLLVESIHGVDPSSCSLILDESADRYVAAWQDARAALYEMLMLAPRDFAGKLMMLYGTFGALSAGEIGKTDWALTDAQLIDRLLRSGSKAVRETTQRWLVGELWDTTPLYWMHGARPAFREMWRFSEAISSQLRRRCFAYAIKDKRARAVRVRLAEGTQRSLGVPSDSWVLGVGSPTKRRFTVAEVETVMDAAARFFTTEVMGPAVPNDVGPVAACLF